MTLINNMCVGECPAGWGTFESRCYLFVADMMAFEEAEHDCHTKGAHLVSIATIAENYFVYRIRCVLFKFLTACLNNTCIKLCLLTASMFGSMSGRATNTRI